MQEEPAKSSVARAALAGASRETFFREALNALVKAGAADRIGVWLEVDLNSSRQNEVPAAFHGLVWDREQPEIPREWLNLSVEPPLPEELLLGGKTVEWHLAASGEGPMIGQLVGLRRALWVPVAVGEHLRGVILLGSKGKPLGSSRERAESVAAELALALELQQQRKIARAWSADLAIVRRLLGTPSDAHSIEAFLASLAASCTASVEDGNGLGATFALVGTLPDQPAKSGEITRLEFHWCSGDQAWTRTMESEPLANVWRRALEARRIIGSEPQLAWAQAAVARIVAFPLEADGQLLGILVAGLSAAAVSLATLDRLELRALLAASALKQRKRIAAESQQERSQQVLLDLLREPLLFLDETGKITALSRGARELLDRDFQAGQLPTLAALPSAHLSDLFCGRDRERLQRWLQRSLELASSGLAVKEELPVVELSGGLKVRLHLATLAPGQAAAILFEPQEAFESGRPADHAEAELQNVIEWLEEGVVLFDAHDNVRAMNTRFEQIVGLASGEAGKIKTLETLIARLQGQAADPARFAARWRELARGIEGGVREELQMVRPAPRILERAVRPVLDGIGRQLGRVEIYRDLTAGRVFQSKLLQTEKLAALGQMVSGIAHELSNPLTSILGYAQRLLRRPNAAGRSEEARQIYHEAERAGTILRQLLLHAREALPERRLISLNQIVMRAMELQRFSLAAEKIHVEIDLDPALPFVHGDAGQLQQVLMNLLGNARQALEQQGQEGIIRLRTKRIGERRVLLEVEDNGPGIPQAIQARIFDPFFTTKPAGVGTGLGLAIVLSVVREHGGQVRVSSPPHGGALFQIELPAASERQQEEAPIPLSPERATSFPEAAAFPSPAEQRAAPFESGKGRRVLVVEDEPTVARLIADVLEDEGMQVDVLLDGREALERAARESYDLVICDMKMPGLDGQHFYKSLERAGHPLREHFLFVTGDIMGLQTREFLERNRLPHVAKPFRVEELTGKVHAVLGIPAHPEVLKTEVVRKNVARNG